MYCKDFSVGGVGDLGSSHESKIEVMGLSGNVILYESIEYNEWHLGQLTYFEKGTFMSYSR